MTDGFVAGRVIGAWIAFHNTERPHSALGGRTPAEAYAAGRPVDMVDNASALPTSPQAQQQQKAFKSIRGLAARSETGIHLKSAANLSENPLPTFPTNRDHLTQDCDPAAPSRC
jgi:hypothetical protein